MMLLLFGLIVVIFALSTAFALRARRRWLAQRKAPSFIVTVDPVALVVTDLQSTSAAGVRLPWSEVCRVVAYKRDLLAYDCICLFIARADGTGVELNERMDEWTNICKELPRFLPGCLAFEDWLFSVTFPAFATNPTELYACDYPSPVTPC